VLGTTIDKVQQTINPLDRRFSSTEKLSFFSPVMRIDRNSLSDMK